jgi:hypothetical protein
MAITDTMKTLTNMHVSNASLYLFIFKNLIKMEGLSPPSDSRVSANLIGGEEC